MAENIPKDHISRTSVYNLLNAIGGCGADIETDPYTYGWNKAIDAAIEGIGKLPAVEYTPVKHGHWVYKERTKLSSTGVARITEEGEAYVVKNRITVRVPYCSECGDHGDNVVDATPYCPNCEAKMDGGNENE